MLSLGLAEDELGADNVADAVGQEDGGGHEALLGVAGDVGHAERDDEADGAAEEARDGVAHDGRGRAVRPLALPDDGAPGDDGEARQDEHEDADVVELGAQVAREEDDDEAQPAEGELEQDRVEGAPAERRDDEGSEATDCAVHGVCGCHHDEDEVRLGVEEGLLDLRLLDRGAAHARLAVAQTLDGGEALLLGEEPG